MKKERKPLTTREKVLIGVGVVGACVAGCFAYGYFRNVKIADELSDELGIVKDEVEVMKHIIIESDIIPNSLQNGSNKISRVQKKITDTLTQIDKYPNDITLRNALEKHKSKLADLLYKHSKTEELGRMMEEDNITYM